MKPGRAPIPAPPAAILRSLYLDEGLSTEEVGERLGASRTTALRWLREAEVPIRAPGSHIQPLPVPPEDVLRRAYVDDRLPPNDIAREHGASSGATVYKWLEHYGIPLRGRSDWADIVPGVWRRVVGQRTVPYDRDRDGNLLTLTVSVMECGHTKRPFVPHTRTVPQVRQPPSTQHRCRACEKGKPPEQVVLDVAPGCCDACKGSGSTHEGPCWDCLSTGHTHPKTEDC